MRRHCHIDFVGDEFWIWIYCHNTENVIGISRMVVTYHGIIYYGADMYLSWVNNPTFHCQISSMKWALDMLLNILWPSDPQAMACCQTTPNHCLKQCWLIVKCVLWHSRYSNFMTSSRERNMCSDIIFSKLLPHIQRTNKLIVGLVINWYLSENTYTYPQGCFPFSIFYKFNTLLFTSDKVAEPCCTKLLFGTLACCKTFTALCCWFLGPFY